MNRFGRFLRTLTQKVAADQKLLAKRLESPAVAKLALQKYTEHCAALDSISDPLQRVRLELPYPIFVAAAHLEMEQKDPNFRRRDSAGRGRLPIHRIGPRLAETTAFKNREDASDRLQFDARLQRTVDGLMEDIVREQPHLSACAAWKRVEDHFVQRGWSDPIDTQGKKNPRRLRLRWTIEGTEGSKTYGQFEKIFTRCGKPVATIAG